jgi:hypothetical protein
MTSIVICDNPFQTFIEPHQVRAAGEFETLAEMAPTTPGAWLCMVGDRCIPQDQWHYYPPPGSVVQFRAIPQGGGGGGSRSILTLIALVAINSFTFGGLTGFSLAAARVGATIAATALINNLIPVQAQKPDQRYTAQAQGNQARLGGVIPEQFGFDNGFPDLCSQPYSFYPNRTTQTLHVLLCLGEGQLHICKVSNGDTDIGNYDDVDIVRIGPGQSTMDGPGTGYENIDDQNVIDPRWVTNQDATLVEMRPGNFAGPFTVCGPGRTVDTIGIDLIQPQGMSQEVRMRWRNEAQLIDDFEQPLGDWFSLGSHTTTRQSNGPRYIITGDLTVPAGRYWVRCIRTDEVNEPDLNSIDKLSILAIRGHLVDANVNVNDCTFVGVRVRATGQINGSLRFRVMSYRMLPVWNGSAWSAPQITRNPAWAIAHINRTRGVPDERIDLAQLLTLASVWDSRYDSFDFKFGEQVSMWDAMSMAARVGRAVPLIRGSRYTVVRDAIETLPAASYGMRNIVRSSLQMKPALATSDQMRTLDMEYFDHRRQTFITVTAQMHDGVVYGYRTENEVAERAAFGIPAPDENRRGRIKIQGIIGFNHAMRTVTYTLADRLYRNVDVEFDSEMDGQLPCPLNLVQFQHEIGDFGQAGDVVSWDVGTLTLETTEPLRWTNATHAIRFTRPTGYPTLTIRATQGANEFQMILDSGDYAAAVAACTADQRGSFEIITLDADRDRTRYVFGPLTRVGALAKVRGIVPSDERRNGMRIVLEDNRVHTVDAQWIAPDRLPSCEVAVPVASFAPLIDGVGSPGQYPTGTMSTGVGDLQIVYLVSNNGAPLSPVPPAPTGWTLIASGNELASGSAIAVYRSYYSGSNAAVNTTNFPSAHSLLGLSYPGATFVQASTLTVTNVSGYTLGTIALSAMPSGPGVNSRTIIIAGSRENVTETTGDPTWTVSGADAVAEANAGFIYYQLRVFETENDTGAKTVNKPLGPYTAWGIQIEIST